MANLPVVPAIVKRTNAPALSEDVKRKLDDRFRHEGIWFRSLHHVDGCQAKIGNGGTALSYE